MLVYDAYGIANSVDPDLTAPLGFGFLLFAQIYLSENLGLLWYFSIFFLKLLKRPSGRAVSAPDFGSRGRGFESRWRRDSSRT